MNIPSEIKKTQLYMVLEKDSNLLHELICLRSQVIPYAEKIANLLPEFTDHSVRHMDDLWQVADIIFTEKEFQKFSTSEAFVLSCSFYLHDLGMAFAGTAKGLEEIKESSEFNAQLERIKKTQKNISSEDAEKLAVKATLRILHAQKAEKLITEPLPGTVTFLIERAQIRDAWAEIIGKISASHHWSIPQLNSELGERGPIAIEGSGKIDEGFVACALRIIDYAHINKSRAIKLERILRGVLPRSSLSHWDAQEYILGPSRDKDFLKYASSKAISSIDGWWLFFQMARGLSEEIIKVKRYLNSRECSSERFSLDGVYGVDTPQDFSKFVKPLGFDPVDIQFYTPSIERLISLLGGESLYGNNKYAPLRELLQNAVDAIGLRQFEEGHKSFQASIEIKVDDQYLSVTDTGIGMDEKTIRKYLLGIAGDFWQSEDFFNSFSKTTVSEFQHVGRFGIGFLSVFMIGEEIVVTTTKRDGPSLELHLNGVGNRGSIKALNAKLNTGTKVQVPFTKQESKDYSKIEHTVRALAPMLQVPIKISTTESMVIEPGWWKKASKKDLISITENNKIKSHYPQWNIRRHFLYQQTDAFNEWTDPEITTENYRIFANPSGSKVHLCSKGFYVTTVSIPGLSGIVDVPDIQLNAARSEAIHWDSDAFRKKTIQSLFPKMIDSTNSLASFGNIPQKFENIALLAKLYGNDLIIKSDLPWLGYVDKIGNYFLKSFSEMVTIFRTKNEVLIGYGLAPWQARRNALNIFSDLNSETIILPVSNSGQSSFGSYDEKEPTEASFNEHFIEHDLEETQLLEITLKCVSVAWDIPIEQLKENRWIRNKNDCLCSLLRKPLSRG
jgi:hypothetical protein